MHEAKPHMLMDLSAKTYITPPKIMNIKHLPVTLIQIDSLSHESKQYAFIRMY